MRAKNRPKGEIVIPPAALKDPRSVEMLRLWIAKGGLHCAINIGHWCEDIEEDLAWGRVLADAIQHIANALAEEKGTPRQETVRRIRRALEDELAEPTVSLRGRFVKPRR